MLQTIDDSQRERYLDALRALAIVRVILWHALGAAVLTYMVAAVPAMFFVTGSLLAKSFRRRPPLAVVGDRLRRLLLPLWAFTAYAFALMWFADVRSWGPNTTVPWRQVLVWLLPFQDPKGSAWEAGYLSAPLWYLRVLLWLLLLSPLLDRGVRRFGTWTLLAPLASMALTGWLRAQGHLAPERGWQIGDFGLYGTFLTLGLLHRSGRLDRIGRAGWAVYAAICGGASVAWVTLRPPPDWVVNDSHVAHLLVGLAWLCAALAARPLLDRAATSASVGPLIEAISQRSLSLYLWHTSAIVAVYWFLAGRQWATGVHTALVVLLVLPLSWLLALLAGGIEDWAAQRRPRLLPGPVAGVRRSTHVTRLTVAGALVAAVVVGGFASNSSASPRQAVADTLRVPSRAPAAPTFDGMLLTGSALPIDPDVVTAELDERAQRWLDEHEVPGARLAVRREGILDWVDAFGVDSTGAAAMAVDDRFPIQSLTKSFTAMLVWRAIDAGLLDLDASLPALRDVPDFPYAGQITIRQLLGHRSGLLSSYVTASGIPMTNAVQAVRESGLHPLTMTPGNHVEYSTVNYLVLGLLLEQVSNRSYDDLLRDLLDEAGLPDARHAAPTAGAPNFSTAGLEVTISELAQWGEVIGDPSRIGVSGAAVEAMRDIDVASSIGAGVWGYCPCSEVGGVPQWSAIGHSSPYTIVQYWPDVDVSVVVNLSVPTFGPEIAAPIVELTTDLVRIATGRA